jgi:hypothetical protein
MAPVLCTDAILARPVPRADDAPGAMGVRGDVDKLFGTPNTLPARPPPQSLSSTESAELTSTPGAVSTISWVTTPSSMMAA